MSVTSYTERSVYLYTNGCQRCITRGKLNRQETYGSHCFRVLKKQTGNGAMNIWHKQIDQLGQGQPAGCKHADKCGANTSTHISLTM